MRLIIISMLLVCIASCADDYDVKIRDFQKNKHDLPKIKKTWILGHQWNLSEWFIRYDSLDEYAYPRLKDYCYAKCNEGFSIESLELYLTIEKISKNELQEIHFLQDKPNRMQSVIAHYLMLLENGGTKMSPLRSSKVRVIKNKHGYRANFIHFYIDDLDNQVYNPGNGFMAIMERRNEFMVVHWYGNKLANTLIADDFIRFIASAD